MTSVWIRDLDRKVVSYKSGMYTALEVQAIALDLMPIGGAAELLAHLPEEISKSVRKLAVDSASWTEAEWESLIRINGPEPTPDENRLCRQKLDEIRGFLNA